MASPLITLSILLDMAQMKHTVSINSWEVHGQRAGESRARSRSVLLMALAFAASIRMLPTPCLLEYHSTVGFFYTNNNLL